MIPPRLPAPTEHPSHGAHTAPLTPRPLRKKRLVWIAALAAAGVLATAGGAYWWAERRVHAALADAVHLQQQVTALQTTLLGYTRYTSYLTAGKQTLAEQMKLLAATVVREEGATQIIEKSVLGLASTGVVAITYTAEYAFGFDLNPQSYELRATDTGIEVLIHRPALVATPAVSNLQHRILSGGLFTDDKGAVMKLAQEAAKRARKQGEAMAAEPAVMALCEKSLTNFLYSFLAKQPGVTQVPRITVVYKPSA